MDPNSLYSEKSSSLEVGIKSQLCTTQLYKNRAFLNQKYVVEKLSARQIAVLIGCSHNALNRAIQRFGLDKHKAPSGWIEYGFKMSDGKVVPHVREQLNVNRMVTWRKACWSYQSIAAELNKRGVRTPAGKGKWYGPTIARILSRKATRQLGLK